MKELAAVSGLPVATIKYYLREGLLPAGRPTSATQAEYDDTHVERLRLIRTLREVGELPIARIEAVIRTLDGPAMPLADLLGEAHHGLGPEPGPATPALDDARRSVLAFVAARGWRVDPDAPAVDLLAESLHALRGHWDVADLGAEMFTDYARAAEEIAAHELATVDPSRGPSDTVRQVIVGTVVFERALVALRRLAQEHFCHVRFDVPPPGDGTTGG